MTINVAKVQPTMRLFSVDEYALALNWLGDFPDFESAEYMVDQHRKSGHLASGRAAYLYVGDGVWFLYDEEGEEGWCEYTDPLMHF